MLIVENQSKFLYNSYYMPDILQRTSYTLTWQLYEADAF